MSTEVAVIEQTVSQELAEAMVKSPKSTRTRAEILAPLKIADDPTKSLASVIKGELKRRGLKTKDATAEYLRILREDTNVLVLAKMEWAKTQGYLMELKTAKDTKDGAEKFSVNFIPPKAPKQLSVSEQDKLTALLGKDSALAKQVMETLQKAGQLAQAKIRNVEAETVTS